MRKDQRLHREPDPRVRRSLVVAFATSALLVAGALTVVGVRVEQVHLAYRLDAVRSERGRSEERIRQLGMTVPGREQVRQAREYVPGGSNGVAAARLVRSESVIR